jgi:hypothetical protein
MCAHTACRNCWFGVAYFYRLMDRTHCATLGPAKQSLLVSALCVTMLTLAFFDGLRKDRALATLAFLNGLQCALLWGAVRLRPRRSAVGDRRRFFALTAALVLCSGAISHLVTRAAHTGQLAPHAARAQRGWLFAVAIAVGARIGWQFDALQHARSARVRLPPPPTQPAWTAAIVTCSICYVGFARRRRRRTTATAQHATAQHATVVLACGHRFHERCVSLWLAARDTCPLCRAHVTRIVGADDLAALAAAAAAAAAATRSL